ncbi:MAG: MBL fold metallo-hydrolase [Aquabacterium sp.]|jgi:glyoxylase-like metal-dependent hydrolase (beta-lactamase superfamily II)|uniref:MBL fold metallo-hydrolase n=1 Tax=Aquabacterium sp. TaxID=1872578 RepID=UPI002A36CF92|nr:MBL fold metallo-hydrolase [Aquabacterium sp.]MDX9843681.1 MBL fold metallo-hydrolase [Aquabacterium sp.]
MKFKLSPLATAMVLCVCAHLIPAASAQSTPSLPAPSVVQVPGVERHQLGEVEVFALSDKRFLIDATRFAKLPQSEWPQAMAQSFKSDPGLQGVTAYAIRWGSTVVLINAGRGARQGDDLGQVAENLKSAGISSDEVSAVFLTSLHADQVSGLLGRDEQRQFKNAQLYASQEAMVHWLADHHYVQAPDEQKVSFATTITSVMPYVKSGKLQPVETGVSMVPGLSVVSLPGGTPGTVGYLIESGGHKLLITGDGTASKADRRRALTQAAKQRWLVADGYVPFPGFERVQVKAGGALSQAPLRATVK